MRFSTLIWGLIAAGLIYCGLSLLWRAYSHQGVGIITNDYGDSHKVTEFQYKRIYFVEGGACLAVGVWFAVLVVKPDKKKSPDASKG